MEANEQYRVLFEQNPQPLFVWEGQSGRILGMNRSACETYGYSREELLSKTVYDLRAQDVASQNEPLPVPGAVLQRTYRRRDGGLREGELHTEVVVWEGAPALLTLVVDVTTRNESERQARRISRLYATSSRINHTIFTLPDRRSILQAACDIAVEAGDFRLAWIGVLNEATTWLDVAAYAGSAPAYLRNIRVTTSGDEPEGRGPMGTAIRERRTVAENDFLNSPTSNPWREEAERNRLRASLCAPIMHDDVVIGGLGLYGGEPGMFQEQEVRLIEEVTSDIALALDNLKQQTRLNLDERIRRLVTHVYELIAADAPLETVFEHLERIVCEYSPESDARIVPASGAPEAPHPIDSALEMPIVAAQGETLGYVRIARGLQNAASEDEAALYTSVAQLASIAIERTRGRERMEHQGLYDALTDLPNRVLFYDRLNQAIAAARRHGTRLVVGLLDFDRFKLVNDTLGHSEGDVLLRAASERFRACLRADETIARMGGDEFLVIFTDIQHPSQVEGAARRLLGSLDQPFQIGGREIFIRASLGMILTDPETELDVGTLLRHADEAMYRAKRSGTGFALHAGAAEESASPSDLDIESDLHRALQRNEFVLHYQPFVDQRTGRIVGAEALIRWRHPEHGVLQPDAFIPIAEATGLIVPIGAWTIEQTCRQIAQWEREGMPLPIAVNVSARQFAQSDLQATIARSLAQNAVSGRSFWLEVTETSVMESPTATARILSDLKNIGVRILIDDFGTGYSSLAYLHQFPIDMLKIDRSFVSGMGDSLGRTDNCAEIARAIVALANGLNAEVVAAGVETAEQRDALTGFGCRLMQGFFFAKPCPAWEMAAMVRTASLS